MKDGHGFFSQWRPAPPLIHQDLSGKVVLIVGANTGIGFEAAKYFASMKPAKLLVTARDQKKAQNTVLRIAEETSYQADSLVVDLGDFESVQRFLNEVEGGQSRLDLVILNAAMATFTHILTKDKWERTIQVNHLSPSWIALRILPLMQSTAKESDSKPRLVLVSSGTHYWVNFDDPVLLASGSILSKLSDEEYCASKMMEIRYRQSKLLNVLFIRALAERLPLAKNNVLVNNVDPGFCRTDLAREITGLQKIVFMVLFLLFAFTAEQGSRQLVYGALAHAGEKSESELHGSYNQLSHIQEPSDFVISNIGKVVQDRIWKETIDILSKQDPKVARLAEHGVSQPV